ncbi:hypothetical protein AGOR_G00195880 [Albula goreensis]|uniref:Uncharacterized protein n=1 Tax=Albula goreensis TaxID=1534307 RepID=A0A8T3CRM1_9TELE|nr:hypothetical protein AGOR_G00195880 [Albula goreensis]
MRDILFSSFLWGALLLLDAQSWGIGEVWVVGMASGSTQANFSVEWDVCESQGADPALLCTLIGCYTEATPASNSNSSASVSVELIGLGWSWNWTCISVLTELGTAQNGLCSDIDECTENPSVCGPNANCSNTVGGYSCSCHHGYRAPPGVTLTNDTHSCQDVDECQENSKICGPNASCSNTMGSYTCQCDAGFIPHPKLEWEKDVTTCTDVDECQENSKICGPNASCSNTMGSYTCQCDAGFIPHPKLEWEKDVTTCKDVDECKENSKICGPNASCSNTMGSYTCQCDAGFIPHPKLEWEKDVTTCKDVDECQENSKICGPNASCSNTMGSYTCQCDAGFIPHPKLEWEKDVTTCKGVTDSLNPGDCKDKSKEECQLDSLSNLLNDSSTLVLPPQTVQTLLETALGAVDTLTQGGKGEAGDGGEPVDKGAVLKTTEKLVATLVEPTETYSNVTITTETIEVKTFAAGPKANLSSIPPLQAKVNLMTIDLLGIAKNNNGSGAVVFMAYTNMEDVLKAELFYTENDTIKTMMSKVVAASIVKTKNTTLPKPVNFTKTKNTTLPKPVNFTLKHQREMHPKGQLTCVYWNDSSWSVDGCEATETNTTHTVCTCAHLSTFALIMQTDKPPEDDSLLELITMVALSVGLACLALAILTFIFCTWNPKVNNTARLNLSMCLFLAHLLLLLVQKFLHLIRPLKLVCSVLAGIQHFLFLSSFVWMYLEALQLFLLVRRLREVKVIHHESVHWGYLLLIGYGVPCLVVSVSAGLFPDGYGNEQCWLKTERGFKWSFLGPVCYILTMNIILFTGVIGSLRATLADLNREISLMRDTRVMVFKALVQFVILGCPWVLGFFVKNNKMLEYLFILSVSQQGTFIFLVHCVLNKEVRAQYRTWWKRFSGSNDSSSSSFNSSSQSITR